jgi:hypothetical protein
MRRTALRPSECARALWLLGLEPPVEHDELARAWKLRVARTHPDLHALSERRTEAATVLTTAINQARDVVSAWIDSGREWPTPSGRPKQTKPRAHQRAEPTICRHTGLRAGDLVRVRPYDTEPLAVRGTEVGAGDGIVWVLLAEGSAAPAAHVRLAAFGCPVCGACEGPVDGDVVTRPCGDCLRDLRRLERRPSEAGRIRSAIEARSEGGRATARVLDSEWLEHRAHECCRWARRLRGAGEDDLRAALLGAFTRAFERWAA